MKKVLTFLFIFFVVFYSAEAQPKNRGNKDLNPLQKIQQLEKAKLIEALNLNEETAVRFFARRNDHQKRVREIFEKYDAMINEIDKNFKKGIKESDSEIKDQFNNLLALDENIASEKKNFYRSLDDIFTPAQIVKLIVFENKFRREIRETLMNRGPGPRK
jgi:hypothetical protein